MAPNGETLVSNSFSRSTNNNLCKPGRLSMESLHRTISDISFELSKEVAIMQEEAANKLMPISEVEDVKCECCSMSEECTPEYIQRVRNKFSGKWICGLCAEAVKEELEKKGGGRSRADDEEALSAHMSVCVRFNRLGRTHPALYHAEAVREILKKSSSALEARAMRAKSISPKGGNKNVKGGIARSLSCIPAITRDCRSL